MFFEQRLYRDALTDPEAQTQDSTVNAAEVSQKSCSLNGVNQTRGTRMKTPNRRRPVLLLLKTSQCKG
ncbi:uncharacterized [Tachysurus ichikawai]